MTLLEFCHRYSLHSISWESGAQVVIPNRSFDREGSSQLWHLTDYAVSSRTAGAIWLVPRTGENT